jgi:hypothetical protein
MRLSNPKDDAHKAMKSGQLADSALELVNSARLSTGVMRKIHVLCSWDIIITTVLDIKRP